MVKVWCGKLEPVLVGGHGPVPAYRHCLRIDLAFKCARKVYRLQIFRTELGEYAINGAPNTFFEFIEKAHNSPSWLLSTCYHTINKRVPKTCYIGIIAKSLRAHLFWYKFLLYFHFQAADHFMLDGDS